MPTEITASMVASAAFWEDHPSGAEEPGSFPGSVWLTGLAHGGSRLAGAQPFARDDGLEIPVSRDRPDDRVDLRLEEDDQRDQLLVRSLLGRRQDTVPGGPPAFPRPPRHQVRDVHGERVRHVWRVRPGPVLGLDLQPAIARLPVKDRQEPPVGVRGDPELALLGWP